MEDILRKITDRTALDLQDRRRQSPISALQDAEFYQRQPLSLIKALREGSGIIAEHKRRSPSKGDLNHPESLAEVVTGYKKAGASAISCLTDEPFFGGTLDDLKNVRAMVNMPVLRKDFIVNTYQIDEAKAYGADAILLIAACLTSEQMSDFAELAIALGLSILFEVHNRAELDNVLSVTTQLPTDSFCIGVNNRNLKLFKTDVDISRQLIKHFPSDVLAVSESGLNDPTTVKELKELGFQGFLIGEHFMKSDDAGAACAEFIKKAEL
jgi:indole-3-glycerol phosphate synthase